MRHFDAQTQTALRAAAVICHGAPCRAPPDFVDKMMSASLTMPLATGLFDFDHYTRQYDHAAERINPVLHYCLRGAREGLSPHPLFRPRAVAGAVAADQAGMPTLVAWLLHPHRDAISPHPLFDPALYAAAAGPADGRVPLVERFLAASGADAPPFSPYFSVPFYLAQSQGEEMLVNPLLHYELTPIEQRRDCNPMFHAGYYRTRYPDVAAAGMDPLEHFILHGYREHREPNPFAIRENHGRERSLARYLLDHVTIRHPA